MLQWEGRFLNEKNIFSNYADFVSERPFEFSKRSSIGCGGKAKIAFYPRSISEMTELLARLERDGISYCVVGLLTNVLPPDEGTEKVIVCTKKMTGIEISDNKAFVLSGVTSTELLRACRKTQKSGLEFLTGIPCTLGGALFMNAGAGGTYIAESVESVLVYRSGQTLTLSLRDCKYGYKASVFMENNDVILGGTLRVFDSDEKKIAERERSYRARRMHLPKGKSMGCVFKNPDGGFAGELIERSGLKGLRVGDAKVSELHGNFIINDGKATAKEIRTLISLIKNAVFAQYGIMLKEEIRFLT